MTDQGEYLRARDLARITGMSIRTARRWIAERILGSGKIGGARLVHRSELERLLSPPIRLDESDPGGADEIAWNQPVANFREGSLEEHVPSLL
jgi:excisionase family DNA binding protein